MLVRLFPASIGRIFFVLLLLYPALLRATDPAVQASGLTVSDLGSGTLTLSWTRGDGDFVLVVGRRTFNTVAAPVDGTTYTADNSYSNGSNIPTNNFVVYSGTGTSINIRELDASSDYSFEAYEFNTGGSPDPDYLTTSPATVSTNTLSALVLYSFQSGNAEDASSWTTDSSGETLVNSAVPGVVDEAVILVNRTITVTENNFDVNHMRIEANGTLALGSTTGHNYSQMSGTGLATSSETHPGVSVNNFASTSGGTFEYITSGSTIIFNISTETLYNNLTIDNTLITVSANLTVNGTLTLENNSTMTMGNDTNIRTFDFNSITVNSGSTLAVNTPSVTHPVTISGDITNAGTIDFTAQTGAEYTSDPIVGRAEVTFDGTGSQTISCSGSTDFFRFIVDKGSGQSSTLTVSSTSTSNFRIFGRNDQVNTSSGDDANPTIAKALWIKNGTLELGANITLESLTEGGSDYFIPQNGALHVNGADVTVTTTANGTSNQSLNLVGKLQVSSGSYSGSNTGGITYAGSAELDVDGGTVTISQLRASSTTIGSANALSYDQSGGTVVIDNSGTNSSSEARLDMEAANITETRNSFAMSAGSLIVSNPNTVAGISIITKDSDFSITGGTVLAEVNDATNFGIVVNGSFNNLTLREDGDGASGDIRTADDGPITTTAVDVNGNLTLTSNVDLTLNSDDLTVGGNLVVNTGSTFTPGTNTITFDGSSNQVFTMDGTITSLNSLTMNKSGGELTPSAAMTLGGDLTLTAGTFQDNSLTHTVAGDVTNSALHSGSGAISLIGTATQSIGGDGTGIFQNLTLFNTNGASAPISTSAAITVNGTLTFSNDKLFNIGSNLLSLGSASVLSGSSSSRYIQTSGANSDGGVSKTYPSAGSFTWPIGVTSHTPATINVGTASSAGTINVKPVDTEHPNVTVAGTSLTYYWRVSSSGFSGESNITHTYVYADGDIAGTEADYIYARFNTSTSTWTTGDTGDVNDGTNTIGGTGNLAGATFIDGDFTAGDPTPSDPFGAVTIFYSRNDAPSITTTGADWDVDSGGGVYTTWSTDSHGGAAAGQRPEDATGAKVIIASGHTVNLSSNGKTVGSLELTGTLDLGTTSAQTLGAVSSTGTLRISSTGATASLPTADLGDFTGTSGGTMTYYKSGTQDFTLPSSPTTYRNLSIETGTGSSAGAIDLPAVNLTISNDFTVSDGSGATQSGTVRFAESNNISVGNDLTMATSNAQSSTLSYRATGTARSISVTGNVTLGTSNTLNVVTTNASAHTLTISGSLTNNGTLDLVPASGTSVATTFSGSSSNSITGTGATTEFGALTINKGTSSASEMNVNATAFSLASLTLTNGTFRLTSAQTITPSTTTFTVPSTAMLAVSGGTINLATGAADGNDLFLNGELELISGSVVVGNTANSNNNDIEYASTGTPTIDVQGGTLTVNGQIRRSTSTTSGNLVYSQTGGTVNIHGSNSQNSRAKLEIANSGTFTMTTGTINILRGSGTTFNDLYLHPTSSTVSGGTIDFTPGTSGVQTFTLSTTTSLNDLVVTGNGAGNSASLTLQNQALTLSGMTITEANSTFDANGFAVNISGDFSNTGTFTPNSNTVTFNGTGAQAATINASTSFHDMVMNKSGGTLTLSGSSDISVGNDLTLTSGTLEDGGRTINVTRNFINNATHTSGTIGTGGVSLTDANHTISGTGIYGNLTLTGSSRTTTVSSVITLNADLDFTGTVVFDIESNDLTFGSSATITGSSFSSSKMIRTSANNDIVKNFPASTLDWTFPIGIGTDYTPVRTNVTSNSSTGTITVQTFDERHPLTSDAGNTELTRYWTLATTGGLSSATATVEFTYVDADVQGTESNYVTGTVIGGDWSPAGGTGSTVTAGSNLISLSTSTIAAEYTAGETAEFAGVSTYFSRATGDWETAGTWSTISHVGAAATVPPNGHKVEIRSDHTVTVTSNSASAFSVVLGGTLTLGTTISHDFGTVTGAGTMNISATGTNNFNFPSSDISGFTGTHDFTGSTNGNMLNTPAAFHNLTFSGTSVKNLQNTSFTISNDFSMSAGTVNQTSSATVSLGGSFSNTGATFSDTAGTLDLSGTGAQSITASGGSTTFNNITISNTSGTVSINDNIDMNGAFTQAASTTLDMDANCIGGTGSITVNGRIETTNTNGLSGGATTTFENTLASVTLSSGSTIAYDATGAQSVTARTDYDGLEVGGTGTKSMGGATTVAGALNVSAGELSIGANTLSLNGTVTGAGTITGSTTSNISVGGTGDAGTIDFSSGSETLGSLTVNRTSTGTVSFEESFTVNSAVTLTNGIVNLAEGTTVTVGASGNQGTITGGTDDIYFNTDPVDDDLDTNPDIDVFHEGTDITIPMGYNPFFSLRLSCPTCSGHKFKGHIKRGPYNTPPSSNSRVTTNVVAAQWDLRKIQGGTVDVTVELCWSSSAETAGLGSNVAISIWDSNLGSPFWDAGNNFGTKTGSGPFCKTRTFTVDGNQRIFMAVTNNLSPLPITLVSFTGAMNNDGDIDLDWQTADELNNDYFQVQRSDNGLTDWDELDFVSGKGTTSDLTNYRYTDTEVNKDSGFIYYRLKQVDFNGTFDYSPVIAVPIQSDLFVEREKSWTVTPNPSSGYDLRIVLSDPNFNASDEFGFRLFNTAGQMLYDTRTTGAEGVTELIDKLTFSNAGIYILEIQSGDKVERHRLIKN